MRREPEYFGEQELSLLYVAQKLKHALRLEQLLTDAGLDYVVESDEYAVGLLFRRVRVGAFFYVAPDHASAARDVLRRGGVQAMIGSPDARSTTMAIAVEVNLKIPGLTIRSADQPVRVINNSAVRFARMIDVPAIPKPGAMLEVPVGATLKFGCTVTRAEWHEERAIFIVSCQFSKARITPDDYHALINNADWTQKILGA